MSGSAFLLVIAAAGTVALSSVLTASLRRCLPGLGFIDVPNQRSAHRQPIPRAGGIAFLAAAVLGTSAGVGLIGVEISEGFLAILPGLSIVVVVSTLEDRSSLSPWLRLGAHVLAAGGFLFFWGQPALAVFPEVPAWVGLTMLAAWLVALTNIFNFMDGIDGLGAGQGLLGAAGLALLAWPSDLSVAAAALALSLGGFLVHNWPPAKVFMGDVGATSLGFFLGAAAAVVSVSGGKAVPFTVWIVMFGVFLFDAGFTLLRRLARREKWYASHRQHVYQRLVHAGWPHRRVTLLYLAIAAVHLCVAIGMAFGIMTLAGGLLAAAVPLVALCALGHRVVRTVALQGSDS